MLEDGGTFFVGMKYVCMCSISDERFKNTFKNKKKYNLIEYYYDEENSILDYRCCVGSYCQVQY